MERDLWENGGYIKENGVCLCDHHHKLAENDVIPPQAFWRFLGIENPTLPESIDSKDVDKWGNKFETPPWTQYRKFHKYPSTRHLPFSYIGEDDDTYFKDLESFTNIPLIVTVKMDGSNATLVKDDENPVRARNGRCAKHISFDKLKRMYWENNLYEKIPENLQIFGEWLYAKHSIHYGKDAEKLESYFQVFNIFDTNFNLWLSWDEVEYITNKLGLRTVPFIKEVKFENKENLYKLNDLAKKIVKKGHEGIVIRNKYPIHYGQFDESVAKYVRKNHVKTDEHWSEKEVVKNEVK